MQCKKVEISNLLGALSSSNEKVHTDGRDPRTLFLPSGQLHPAKTIAPPQLYRSAHIWRIIYCQDGSNSLRCPCARLSRLKAELCQFIAQQLIWGNRIACRDRKQLTI